MDRLRGIRSIRGRSSGRALANQIAASSELRQSILNAPDKVKLYDKNSPSVKQRRARYHDEFIEVMRAIHEISKDQPDDAVHKQVFAPEVVVDNVVRYVAAVAGSEHHSGALGPKMKTSTLRQRVEALWWWAGWEAGTKAGDVWTQWQLMLPAAVHKCAIDFDLGSGKWEKTYFGVPELRLLFSVLCSRTRYVDWYKQHYAAWVLSYLTGARPGTLALSKGYEKANQTLLWKDIKFFRFTDKPGIFLQIQYNWLKGQRDPHHEKSAGFDGAKFLILPCREPENLVVDLTWILLLLGHERKLFGDNSIEDLLHHPSSQLPMNPEIADQAVFVALKTANNTELNLTKALRSNAFNQPLQRSALMAGLAVRVTMYCFRREFITTVGRNLSVEEAKTLANHRSDQLGSYGRYDFGTGDLNVAGIVFGENSDISDTAKERHKYRLRTASAAINRSADFPFQDRYDFVKLKLQENEYLLSFEDALQTILASYGEKFSVQGPLSVANVMKALDTDEHQKENSSLWLAADGMEIANPKAWEDLIPDVLDRSKSYARSFLTAFMSRRKSARNYIIRALHAIFQAEWQEKVEKPSTELVQRRIDESIRLPTIIEKPDAALTRPTSHLDTVNPQRTETLLRALDEQDRDPYSSLVDLEADEATAGDEDPATATTTWNGTESNDLDAAQDDDAPDEVDSDLIDPLAEILMRSSGPIQIQMPGEDEDVDEHMPGSKDEAMEAQKAKFYNETRSELMKTWTKCIEINRSAQNCMTCVATVDGDINPSFLRTDSTASFESAWYYARHAQGVVHDAKQHQFHLWAHDRAKTADGKWYCPLPDCTSFRTQRRLNKLETHVADKHARFLDRLQH